jgi:glyoxylase-like metal-dependent hydrolase (beta-lactamase superfamily II)
MHRWTVGDVEIVRVDDLNFSIPSDEPVPAWSIPDLAPSTHEVGIAFTALAIADGGTRIVVDPWMANDRPRAEPDAAQHAECLLGELAGAGFAPDEVDVVVNSHLDGIGWNTRPSDRGWVPSFPNARYLYPAAEVAAIEAGEEVFGREGRDAFAELDRAVGVERVQPPCSLTESVTLVDAPGHNWGHLAVRIEREGDLAIYPGHLFLTPWDIDDPTRGDEGNPQIDIAIATRRTILDELATRGGRLLTTLLGGSGSGVVERTEAGYRLV